MFHPPKVEPGPDVPVRLRYESYSVTVQTGMITAICAIIDLVLFLASVSSGQTVCGSKDLLTFTPTQPSGLHLIFNLPLSKLYTNSLMSSLNSRMGWKYSTGVARSTSAQESRFVAAPGGGARSTNAIDLADLSSPGRKSKVFSGVRVRYSRR